MTIKMGRPLGKITKKQADVFRYIIDYLLENGFQPSIDEISDYFKIDRSAVHQRLVYLEKKGLIERVSARAVRLRGIKLYLKKSKNV